MTEIGQQQPAGVAARFPSKRTLHSDHEAMSRMDGCYTDVNARIITVRQPLASHLRDRTMARSILAVIVGYLIFALSAFAFFQISRQPPHQAASMPIMVGSITFGMVFALLGGYVAAWLARRRPLAHGVAVAAVLALGAAISLLSTLGNGAVWSQTAALVLMAPCAIFGGWLRCRQVPDA